MRFLLSILLLALDPCRAFVAVGPFAFTGTRVATTQSLRQQKQPSLHPLSMSLRPLYDELTSSLSSQFRLTATDFTRSYDAAQWTCGSVASGTAEWWAESSPQYLTGMSACTRQNLNDQNDPCAETLTINVWMGPSYDVPHMLLTFGNTVDGRYFVQSDYVPRGATVLGSDPQYLATYYGNDVQASYTQAYASGGYPIPPPASFDTRLLASPVVTAVAGLDATAASDLIRTHVNRFQQWVTQASPVPARSRGSFNLRDDKLRQFYFRGQMSQQTVSLGPEWGPVVAAVNTGPVAEAYVGGGS
jgi:hypothetical protein